MFSTAQELKLLNKNATDVLINTVKRNFVKVE